MRTDPRRCINSGVRLKYLGAMKCIPSSALSVDVEQGFKFGTPEILFLAMSEGSPIKPSLQHPHVHNAHAFLIA